MKALLWLSRLLVGTLFILSGLIKANDSRGFGYKLEEYFEVFNHDITHSSEYVLSEEGERLQDQPCADLLLEDFKTLKETPIPESEIAWIAKQFIVIFNWSAQFPTSIALFISILEIFLGLCTLFGWFMKPVSWLLLGLIVFFTFLTFYSAYYNKVTDCGCFGDALKLTPWQSFSKDVFLLIFIIPLWWFRKHIQVKPNGGSVEISLWIASVLLMALLVFLQFDWFIPLVFMITTVAFRWLGAYSWPALNRFATLCFGTVISLLLGLYCLLLEPIKDYRPWAVGKNIPAQMKSTPDRIITELVYVNKNNCELVRKDIASGDWSWLTDEFEEEHLFWKQDNRILEKGVEAPVKDLRMYSPENEESMVESILEAPVVYLLVFHTFDKADLTRLEELKSLSGNAREQGVMFVAAAAVGASNILDFMDQYSIPFPIYFNDEKPLKTIVRSNPGLVRLEFGTVTHKWANFNLPRQILP
jgi:uncharacterized membrane protein YphA (DoxX/SURF4 family)